MGMMINRRRVMGGKSLPYDYEVEFLESWGGVYIDTGVLSAAGTLVDVIFRSYTPPPFPDKFLKSYNFSWGGQGFVFYPETSSSGRQAIIYIGPGDGNARSRPNVIRNKTIRFYQESNGVWYYNGVKYTASDLHYNDYNTNSNLLIGDPDRGEEQGPLWACYSLKLHRNDILVRDFIPVVKDNIGYMYDKVSGQLFGNSGTGNFRIGPDKDSAVIITQQQQRQMYGE